MLFNLIDPTTIGKNIKDFFGFLKGIKEARDILIHEKPDVVFAKGGYVTLPVGIAARLCRIPLVIHESDLVMGLANRQMAKFAKVVCVSFSKKKFPEIGPKKLVYTGNPIREDVLRGDGASFLKKIGFSPNKKTILVLGGSQGSQFINENINQILEYLLDCYQLIWIAGERDADLINYEIKNNLAKELQGNVKVFGFVSSEIADIYDASDLIIARSSSSVLFEIAALGKPSILIPLGSSAGGHQLENALYFSRSGAASLFRQAGLEPKKLLKHINYLLTKPEELASMGLKAKKLARLDAADLVAQVIYKEGVENIEQATKSQREAE